ncbi:structural protein [Synechococcus phage S-CBS2]|uniref:structural protein n=1 Tax=Synechococcus phage S-CBS2 TaxID=753084 RepID=UPI00020783F8|nr:structural protein [Synechococcus phage S-CBS2]ADF42387.1 structural protein [Synechococcus phage S-CBS2]
MAVPSNRVPVRVARGLKSALTANLADLLEGELVYAKDEDKLYMIEGGTLVAMGADLAAASILDLGDVEPNSLPDGARYALGGVQFPGNGLWYRSGSRISWGAIDADSTDRTSQITAASGSIFWSTDGATWNEIFFTGSPQTVGDSYYIDITSGSLPALTGDLYFSFSTPGTPSPAPLADGDYLRFDGTDFRPQQLATVAETGAYSDLSGTPTLVENIDDLTDVDTSTSAPTTDQVLAWNGTNWVPSDVSAVGGGVTRIQDATDYEPNTTPPAGTIYYFSKAIANFPEDWTCPDRGTYSTDPGDGTQYNLARYDRDGRDTQSVFPSSGSIWWTFDLTQPWTQMTYTGLGAQSICTANSRKAYNGTVNGWPLDGSTDKILYVALSDLGTGIPIPLAAGDYLRYDGGDFRPKQLATVAETGAYSDLSGAPTLGTAAAAATTDFATAAQGTLADSAVQPTDSIDTLADVTVTTPSNGEALVWNGSAWVNSTVSTVGSIDDLTDVDTTTSAPTNGQVLEWNGTNWVPATIAAGGVTSIIAGTGISVDQATGDVTITATGGGVSGIGVATRVSDSGTAASGALALTGLGSSGMLHTLSTDLDAWVVFYGSAADRTADAGRAYNTDPAAGSGVLAEAYVTTAGAILFTPGTGYMNNDTTETAALYLAVRDQAGAAVNATLTVTAYVQGGYDGVSGGTFGSG